MVSLYRRANDRQRRVLRIIEGAVKNTVDAHKGELAIAPRFARSIAKRAAGTLTAQYPLALAPPPSGASRDTAQLVDAAPRSAGGQQLPASRAPALNGPRAEAARAHALRPAPLALLRKELSIRAGRARRAGAVERIAIYVEVLRLLAEASAANAELGRSAPSPRDP